MCPATKATTPTMVHRTSVAHRKVRIPGNHLRLLALTGMLSMMPCSCVECAGWLLPVALHPAERDQREHRESLHLRFACLLDGFPERRRPTWHEGAHGNSSRDEIAKRHHGAD